MVMLAIGVPLIITSSVIALQSTLSRPNGSFIMLAAPIKWLVAGVFVASGSWATAHPPPADNKPDATLRSTPDTVIWGYIAADLPPALRIKSGQTVRIDTVSHGGLN